MTGSIATSKESRRNYGSQILKIIKIKIKNKTKQLNTKDHIIHQDQVFLNPTLIKHYHKPTQLSSTEEINFAP